LFLDEETSDADAAVVAAELEAVAGVVAVVGRVPLAAAKEATSGEWSAMN